VASAVLLQSSSTVLLCSSFSFPCSALRLMGYFWPQPLRVSAPFIGPLLTSKPPTGGGWRVGEGAPLLLLPVSASSVVSLCLALDLPRVWCCTASLLHEEEPWWCVTALVRVVGASLFSAFAEAGSCR
jgi:hypothetical protein